MKVERYLFYVKSATYGAVPGGTSVLENSPFFLLDDLRGHKCTGASLSAGYTVFFYIHAKIARVTFARFKSLVEAAEEFVEK